jgi:putative glutamine amidotransferase
MPAPLIGITTIRIEGSDGIIRFAVGEKYTQSVVNAGGLPVLIPLNLPEKTLAGLLSRLDGVIFSGGGDIAIEHYGGQPHPRVSGVDLERDRTELFLVHELLNTKIPFLGICRGVQLINVACGGSLYSHIQDQHPRAIKHDYYPDYPRAKVAHKLTVKSISRLEQILGGESVQVNSLHHQGIKEVAPGLNAVAYAPDGLVEGLEIPGPVFRLAVQWHPEELQAYLSHRALFHALVQAAGG